MIVSGRIKQNVSMFSLFTLALWFGLRTHQWVYVCHLWGRMHSLRTIEGVNHIVIPTPPVFKHDLYNRAGDGNRVRTLISILFYVNIF